MHILQHLLRIIHLPRGGGFGAKRGAPSWTNLGRAKLNFSPPSGEFWVPTKLQLAVFVNTELTDFTRFMT